MYFERNLEYLTEYNQHVLGKLLAADTTDLEFIRVKGSKVFKFTDDQGKEFYSASIYDPSYEAEVLLRDVNFDNTGFLILGISSYEVITRILERKTETAWVFVVEKDMRLVRAFLEDVDLSPYFKDRLQRLVLFGGDIKAASDHLKHFLYSLVGFYFLQAEVLRSFSTLRKDRQYYDEIFDLILETLRNHVYNMGNDLDDTLQGIRNELQNLKMILTLPRLRDLEASYAGVPIICVASGPSLDKQLPLLRQAKGRSLIICAESALKVLLRNGIVPDIVCILERGPNSYDLSLSGIDIPEETALFGLTIIDPRIFPAWPKYAVPCFKENLSNSEFLISALGDFGTFVSGNSVAHMSYMLAVYLGGNPVVLIGQDLAYGEDGKTHSEDTVYNLGKYEVDERVAWQIRESLYNEKMLHNRTVYLDGYYGGKVKSRELWRQFLIWMETLVNFSQVPTINATEGGAKIRGTIQLPFQEVLERYCTKPVRPIGEVIDRLSLRNDSDYLAALSRVHRKISDLLEETEDLVAYAKENRDIV
ncbi:6-hydroxymethylpterin diphosphokinase MptE-like protein, partial [Kyrpidia sp.]|uniref:motility associated factor glycosyltransferase family protein n=1 Tax=Kyrpidia sp. TaxID=2073077 RepID=UPI0025903853